MSFQPFLPVYWIVAIAVTLLAACAGAWLLAKRSGAASAAGSANTLRWLRRAAVVLVLTFVAAGPAIEHDEVTTYASGVEIYLVVDRTGSMAAEDYGDGDTRLSGVRTDLRALAAENTGARFSIITFDSIASQQLPLSSDVRAVNAWADTLTQELSSLSTGSLVDRPLDSLTRALQDSAEQAPDHERYVYFFSDGENTANGVPGSYASLSSLISGGAVLGYGTKEGGRMKVNDPTGTTSGYIKDPTQDGEPDAISVLDEASLQSVAQQLGVPYVLRSPGVPIGNVVPAVNSSATAQATTRTVRVYQPLLWPFALVGAALLLWELGALVARATRPVGVNRD
ncbi:VWA domain-containing protein [Rarobacter faecitabidus]|uniref:Ca-activated chloride channel family protein n=1 Tax=Rarobacter faecitabidus TaxID=13243 RepID=A0A542ZNZ4_RARFA|nr:VWA domain-containing protein [Rarobacter faecitabidus]TQL62091.1 Ca-activated chloride channel family protein [Rarobacter faecitabidus]